MAPPLKTAAAGKRKALAEAITLIDPETEKMLHRDSKGVVLDGTAKKGSQRNSQITTSINNTMRRKGTSQADRKAIVDRLCAFVYAAYCSARAEELKSPLLKQRPLLMLGEYRERATKRQKLSLGPLDADDILRIEQTRDEQIEEAIRQFKPMGHVFGGTMDELELKRKALLNDLCRTRWQVKVNNRPQMLSLAVPQAARAVDYFLDEVFGQKGIDSLFALVKEMHTHEKNGTELYTARVADESIQDNKAPDDVRVLLQQIQTLNAMTIAYSKCFTRISSVMRLWERYEILDYYHDARQLAGSPKDRFKDGGEEDWQRLHDYISNVTGRTPLERLHNKIASDLTPKGYKIDTQATIKELRRADFFFALVSIYGQGIMALIPDNTMSRWIKDFPSGLFIPVIELVIKHFPESWHICQVLGDRVIAKLMDATCPDIPNAHRKEARSRTLYPILTRGMAKNLRLRDPTDQVQNEAAGFYQKVGQESDDGLQWEEMKAAQAEPLV